MYVKPHPQLQQLFARYNQTYWRGKLPQYEVVNSEKYHGGYCEKASRRILLHVSLIGHGDLESTLLHEMVHAAVKGSGW